MLSRAGILAQSDDMPTDTVPVPEWGDGETVRVRMLSTKARLRWVLARDKALGGEEDAPDPSAFLVTLGAIDEHGALLFQLQDCDVLSDMRGDIIERISDRILELSGMTDAAAKDAEKNSAESASSTEPSSSPSDSDAPLPN